MDRQLSITEQAYIGSAEPLERCRLPLDSEQPLVGSHDGGERRPRPCGAPCLSAAALGPRRAELPGRPLRLGMGDTGVNGDAPGPVLLESPDRQKMPESRVTARRPLIAVGPAAVTHGPVAGYARHFRIPAQRPRRFRLLTQPGLCAHGRRPKKHGIGSQVLDERRPHAVRHRMCGEGIFVLHHGFQRRARNLSVTGAPCEGCERKHHYRDPAGLSWIPHRFLPHATAIGQNCSSPRARCTCTECHVQPLSSGLITPFPPRFRTWA